MVQGTHTDLTSMVVEIIYSNHLEDPDYLVAPLQQDWTLPPSQTGACGEATAHGQQNSPLMEGLGQSRVQTLPENLPLPSQSSLCPGEHGGQEMGDKNGETKGVL